MNRKYVTRRLDEPEWRSYAIHRRSDGKLLGIAEGQSSWWKLFAVSSEGNRSGPPTRYERLRDAADAAVRYEDAVNPSQER